MSSANRVRLAAIAESAYGVTPGSGDFTEIKFTSEDLTGSPQTTESQAIRSDRQGSGQVNTGLELSGGFDFEVSADDSLKLAIEHAMMSNIVAAAVHTGTLTIGGSGTTLTTDGDLVADGMQDGDFVILGGFPSANNNVGVIINNVVAGGCDIAGVGLTDEAGGGSDTMTRPSYHTIGTVEKSLSISKEFLDLGTRSIAYRGERVSEFSMNFAFGAIVTGRCGLAGNGYELPATPITDSRTVNAAGSDTPLDASNGFGWLLVDNADADICMESLEFTLNNNLTPQNCIGNLAPTDQVPGSAAVSFSSTMHLGANSFDLFLPNKLSQTPIRLCFYSLDDNGEGYAVVMERVQLSFPDPGAGGRDTTVTMQASGTASYDETAGETMRVYII